LDHNCYATVLPLPPAALSHAPPSQSWFNQLNPELKHEPFTLAEEALVRAPARSTRVADDG